MMKLIVLIFITTFGALAFAQEIVVTSVKTSCVGDLTCDQQEYTFKSLKRSFNNLSHFHKILKLYVSNEGVKNLDYVLDEINNQYILKINIEPKPKIIDFSGVEFKGGSVEIPSVLPIKEDDYLDLAKIAQTKKIISDLAKDKGFPRVEVVEKVENIKGGVKLTFLVNLGTPMVISKINITSNSNYLREVLENSIGEFKNKAFDLGLMKTSLENSRKLFLQYGYYLAEIDLKSRVVGNDKVVLFVNVKNTNAYTFYIKGLDQLKTEKLKAKLSETLISYKREMSVDNIQQVVDEQMLSFGIVNSQIKIERKENKTFIGESNILFTITVEEGFRGKIADVVFKGNTYFSGAELSDLFYTDASSLVSSGLHDEKYYKIFIDKLKKHFISQGFLTVFVENPVVELDKRTKEYTITYKIREGIRTQISKIELGDMPEDLKTTIYSLMVNKEGKYFNPIVFQDDLVNIKNYLKSEGYYFAEIKNMNTSDIVEYKQDNSIVDINLAIETGHKLTANEIIIIGNIKTRKILILRELTLQRGELVTSEKIKTSQANLLSLGIFNSVQISPVENNKSNTDVLVFVREKDFGFIEIAPGIRTDLGVKISTRINYNNIDGMNKRITFKGSVNQRTDLSTLDETRRKNASSLIEYDAAVDYAENHIFYSDLDFNSTLSKSRRRFFAFDADIQRVGFGLSYDWTRWLNIGARYQLETISQFDATLNRDEGHFQIGSVTPSVTFDFRNRSVNTTKGAYFNISCEFANPALLSQQNDELTINYYKLINRNKFYFPLSQDVVLAISTAFGIQENLASNKNSDGTTEGYIPNIKVFRLTGADIVRGYEDSEINRLVSRQDISEVEVNSRAYMANLKFEPRLFLSDSTMLGVFYDAGRIFVNEFQEDELRSSVGLSFKYLTPVGSLDFDYGIKVLRKRDADGTLDSPGRLHVSIGFF